MRANVYIVSAPSGSGKTTLLRALLRTFGDLKFSVSHTTRQPREGERDGIDYFFVDHPAFKNMIERGEFLEWAEYQGQLYGTARAWVESNLDAGCDVILDIDVEGASQVRRQIPYAVTIFVMPPSYNQLEQRLRSRSRPQAGASESEESIRRRLEIAKKEILHYRDYDYIVVNDVLDHSIRLLESIVQSGRAKPARQEDRIEKIIASFGGTA
ncbi:MAG TPA: guanylate kinase [Terriglobia bacterium]|nr:guanylate kinase [Terriglobia bacterium]